VIKYHLGKLPLPAPPADYLPRERDAHGITSLPIDEGAMSHLAGLPPLHPDPFDRLLVAQALQHELTIATVNPDVAAYPFLCFRRPNRNRDVSQRPSSHTDFNRRGTSLASPGFVVAD
jgi:PIN domain nuclease of toxin-antitoxin system